VVEVADDGSVTFEMTRSTLSNGKNIELPRGSSFPIQHLIFGEAVTDAEVVLRPLTAAGELDPVLASVSKNRLKLAGKSRRELA
jgi:hypothetical protein